MSSFRLMCIEMSWMTKTKTKTQEQKSLKKQLVVTNSSHEEISTSLEKPSVVKTDAAQSGDALFFRSIVARPRTIKDDYKYADLDRQIHQYQAYCQQVSECYTSVSLATLKLRHKMI